ncbi:hypothetical protein GQ600_26281 [Phytophthora cactorum]|nr:hypothetical protein GQ600_26281 [Phytophthora cactorum]
MARAKGQDAGGFTFGGPALRYRLLQDYSSMLLVAFRLH